MQRMSDKEKWNDFWFVQKSIGNFYNMIKTFPSWNPDPEEKRQYLSKKGKAPANAKKQKYIMEIYDYRDNSKKPQAFKIRTIFMTANTSGDCWGAINVKRILSAEFDGILIIQYKNENRDVKTAKFYLMTRLELNESFAVYEDNRVHFKSNNKNIDKYEFPLSIDDFALPSLDNKDNNELKLALIGICDRLKNNKLSNFQKPLPKYIYSSAYVKILCNEIS